MKLLIITPEIHRLGGVANHYLGLSKHWTFEIEYLFYGKRNNNTPMWKSLLLYPYDYIRCIYKLLTSGIDAVIINPSLRKYQIIRDGLFLLISRLCGKKVITFIHGFDENYCETLKNNRLFKWCYNKSSFIYVLYSGFKKQLINIGINAPIELTTTKVATDLLSIETQTKTNARTILFLARINKDKGIYEAIDTYAILKQEYPDLKFIVCGDGPILQDIKNYVTQNQIKNVEFRGNVTGKKLQMAYAESDIYILPTEQEGMATTILEAMAFGLVIISRPVGGIVDFWKDNMGYLLTSKDPNEYAKAIKSIIDNPKLLSDISNFNRDFASRHFMADKVCKKFETDINKYINQR